MALSNEVLADLKKKCVQAKSKELDFYLFLKAENDEPALVMGLSTDARKEKADIIKNYKAAPAARGIVKKGDDGGLLFEVQKGKESVLKKQLSSTFGGIPSLKAASVVKGSASTTETENETKDTQQPEKQLKKGGLLSQLKALGKKDSNEALARRLEKLENEIDELDDLMGQLKTLDLLSTDEAQIIQGFRDAVRQAQVMGEKDAQGAYAALDSVKSQARTTRNLMAEKEDLWTKIDGRHKQITIKDGFLHPNIAKDFRMQCVKDTCTEAYDFCMLHLKGKFSTPKGRRNGYTIFLDAASNQQINSSEKLIKETLHVSTLPLTPQQLDDKAFWTNVSYDALATDLQNNCIGDPWGRLYPYMLDAPQRAVRAAPLSKAAGILKAFLQRIS